MINVVWNVWALFVCLCDKAPFCFYRTVYRKFYESVSIHEISEHLSQPSTLFFAVTLYYLANMACKCWAVVSVLCFPRQRMSCKSVSSPRFWLQQASLWLTDGRTIRLHQKVQPDSLIWQPSSNQIFYLFLALHQLDKRKSGKQKKKTDINTLIWISLK